MIKLVHKEPRVDWLHPLGPTLVCQDGITHLLTKVERIWLRMGFTNVNQLDAIYNRLPQRG